MNHLLVIVISFICTSLAFSQSSAEVELQNIVPNPGFERYAATPIGWFYKGEHFTKVVKYWSSPTAASPDVFGPKIRVPAQWAEKGFGKQTAYSGNSMVGITVYGCEEGKPHCREYLQIQLTEPLVIGQNYYVEMWVSHLPRSLQINNLGFYFSEEETKLKTDELLAFAPQVRADQFVKAPDHKWVKISGYFIAETEANYLIVGNFGSDNQTQVRSFRSDQLTYAYYYIDDVLVRKEEPIIEVPVREDDLTRIEIEEGKVIQLKNIFFDTDKWELLPRSYVELEKLLHIMHENPSMIIEMRGHTDSRGRDNYNQYLSRKRAKAVVLYLNEHGISRRRTLYKGYGPTMPVASNETEEGRQLNRRVEFMILQK